MYTHPHLLTPSNNLIPIDTHPRLPLMVPSPPLAMPPSHVSRRLCSDIAVAIHHQYTATSPHDSMHTINTIHHYHHPYQVAQLRAASANTVCHHTPPHSTLHHCTPLCTILHHRTHRISPCTSNDVHMHEEDVPALCYTS